MKARSLWKLVRNRWYQRVLGSAWAPSSPRREISDIVCEHRAPNPASFQQEANAFGKQTQPLAVSFQTTLQAQPPALPPPSPPPVLTQDQSARKLGGLRVGGLLKYGVLRAWVAGWCPSSQEQPPLPTAPPEAAVLREEPVYEP